MDELARLKSFLGKRKILNAWGYPLGKSWMILELTVHEVRELDAHPGKWDTFQRLGEAAKKKFRLEELNRKMAKKNNKKLHNNSP